jgi:phosphopantothenoylcysteine decarboxylase/phosphopantothenate--cysteine ligase
VLGVGTGEQACGETGDGRMLEPSELLEDVVRYFQPKVLAGPAGAGHRRPHLRGASTRCAASPTCSSGKMGFAIARAAR